MPKINLLTLLPGDSQATLIDKINYNYDQLLTVGGGPIGVPGKKGETGPVGPQGDPGVTGPQGMEGSKWFVDVSGPTSGSPLGIPSLGDYWLRDSDKEIYRFSTTGPGLDWVDTGINLRGDQVFAGTGTNFNSISGTGDSYSIYYAKNNPEIFSLVLSDYSVGTAGPGSVTGYALYGLNSEKSKFKIATDFGASSNLISFGRSKLDAQNNTSSTFSNTHNPVIKWSIPGTGGSSDTTPNVWDVQFYNPIGNWDILTTGGNVSMRSNLLNRIETSNSTGGTVVNIANSGYFQVLPGGSTGSSGTPYFGANRTGAGVNTVATQNNFSVKGSVSIGQSDSYNNFPFGTGTLGVERGLRVGATGYNPYNIPVGFTGGIPRVLISGQGITGPSGPTGAIFQARLDLPTGTENSWISWGDYRAFPQVIEGSTTSIATAKNVLTQEYATSLADPIATGTCVAGYYHMAGGTNYSAAWSGTGGSGDSISRFKLRTYAGQGTYIETLNGGNILSLQALRYAPYGTGTERVSIGANNNETLRVYNATGGVKINGSVSTPLSNNTRLSVENGGAYFGYTNSSPLITNTYTTADGLGRDMSRLSYIKVNYNDSEAYNGINLEGIFGFGSSVLGGYTPNKSKAIVINTSNDSGLGSPTLTIRHSVDWIGNVFTNGTSRIVGSSTMGPTAASVDSWFGPSASGYGPGGNRAQLFVYGLGADAAGTSSTDGGISVMGNIRLTGTIWGPGGSLIPSSRALKQNIKPLEDSLDKINEIEPVSFEWKRDGKSDLGFIVEDLNEILPEVTTKNEEGNPEGYKPHLLIPLLVKSIQELSSQVKELKEEIEILKSNK